MAKKKRNRRTRSGGNPFGGGGGGFPAGGSLGGGGMGGGGMGGDLAARVRKMQDDMEKAQGELADEIVTGSAGGGMVEVDMDGHQTVQALRLKPEVVDPEDVEMLEDLLMAAINDAAEKVKSLTEERMGGLTDGLNIPGLGL
jgi:DNA-binding YbaB/EbfC family protein